MRVSVVIPVYNRAHELARALRSVLAQTQPPAEIIVADDGSEEDIAATLAAFAGAPLVHLRLPHRGLPAVARNAALRQATGDLIAFLDSDDEWLPDKLSRQVARFEANPELALACANARLAGPGVARDATVLPAGLTLPAPALPTLLRGNVVITSTAVIRRSVLTRTGFFSEAPELRVAEDYELWLRIASCAAAHYEPAPLAVYYNHAGGTSAVPLDRELRHRLAAYRRFRQWSRSGPDRWRALGAIWRTRLLLWYLWPLSSRLAKAGKGLRIAG